MSRLYAFREDRLGFYYQLGERALLGRAPECDLILSDRGASRRHAEVAKDEAGYFLTDLSSTNGTLVNSRPAVGQVFLTPYSTIEIGQEIFIFQPDLEILVGAGGPMMIIDNLPQEPADILELPLDQAGDDLTESEARELVRFVRGLPSSLNLAALLEYAAQALGGLFEAVRMGVLWPAAVKNHRLTSFWSSPAPKYSIMPRGLLTRALERRQAVFWPQALKQVSFHKGRRLVEPADWQIAALPLSDKSGPAQGLLYLETAKKLSLGGLNFLAALGAALAPPLEAAITLKRREGRLDLLENHYNCYNQESMAGITSQEQAKIIKAAARQVARGEARIFITGELGSGKTSLARYIHSQSDYSDGPFMVANLSLISPAVQESALFGQLAHQPAGDHLAGLFEMADGGTLFLKNVEYLASDVQKALLVALEEKIFFPLGADKPRTCEVRIMSSSTKDLWELVQEGVFREDLYLRLNQASLALPPLRNSKIDLGGLADKLMTAAAQKLGLPFAGLDSAAAECLKAYPWPGNIAELKATATVLLLSSRLGRVAVEDLPSYLKFAPEAFKLDLEDSPLVEETERYFIVRALARTYGQVEAAAEIVGLAPEVLIPKMRRLNIDPTVYQKENYPGGPHNGPGQTGTSLA